MLPSGFAASQVIPNYRCATALGILLPVDTHYEIHRADPVFFVQQEDLETGLLRLNREERLCFFCMRFKGKFLKVRLRMFSVFCTKVLLGRLWRPTTGRTVARWGCTTGVRWFVRVGTPKGDFHREVYP